MCNLYRQRSGLQAIMDMAHAMRSTVGNLAPGDICPDAAGKFRPIWFKLAGDGPEPLAFFASIHPQGHTGVRKIKTSMETIDVFAFLATAPNAEVGSVHPKAMPVILIRPDEIEAWMIAPRDEAQVLQRPLPDGALSFL